MKDKTLKELLRIVSSSHNENAVIEIIKRFTPLIKKNAKMLGYDGAESDLIIHLIEVIFSLKSEKIESFLEGQSVKYISSTIKNKSIDIIRKRTKSILEIELFETVDINAEYTQYEINELLDLLSERQRLVVILKYFYGYSDAEIAKCLGISRQAVNKIHRVSISKMRATI